MADHVSEDPAVGEPELGDDVERDHVTDQVASLLGELGGQVGRRGRIGDLRHGRHRHLQDQQGQGEGHHVVGQADQALHAQQVMAPSVGVKIGGHRCSASKIGNPAWRPRRSNRRGVAFRLWERRSKPVDTMLQAIVIRGLGRRSTVVCACQVLSASWQQYWQQSRRNGTDPRPRGGWPVNDPARLPPLFPIGAAGAAGPERRQAWAPVRLLFSSPARCLAARLAPASRPLAACGVKGMTTASLGWA